MICREHKNQIVDPPTMLRMSKVKLFKIPMKVMTYDRLGSWIISTQVIWKLDNLYTGDLEAR